MPRPVSAPSTLALAGLALMLLASPASARHGGDDRSGHHSSGHHSGDHRSATTPAGVTVSSARAVEIARAQGLHSLHEVKFRDGAWKVEGPTANGQWIEVTVHPTSGDVLRREIYASHH